MLYLYAPYTNAHLLFCRHGPSPYRSCFAFESRLRDFKDCALLVANNKGVDSRALELMRERLLLFPYQPVTLSGQQWRSVNSLRVEVSDESLADFLARCSWDKQDFILTGNKLTMGSLRVCVNDGLIYCPLGTSPGVAAERFDIVTCIGWHKGSCYMP